jgi:hypothetical protein
VHKRTPSGKDGFPGLCHVSAQEASPAGLTCRRELVFEAKPGAEIGGLLLWMCADVDAEVETGMLWMSMNDAQIAKPKPCT